MRFLVDICLSPRLADLAAAAAQGRVVLSADTDFGTILARTHASAPSVILIRRAEGRRVEELLAVLAANLATVETAVGEGSVVVLGGSTMRIRRLPIL